MLMPFLLSSACQLYKENTTFLFHTEKEPDCVSCPFLDQSQGADEIKSMVDDFFTRVKECLGNGYAHYDDQKKSRVWKQFHEDFDTIKDRILEEHQNFQREHLENLRQKNICCQQKQNQQQKKGTKRPSEYSKEEWEKYNLRHR